MNRSQLYGFLSIVCILSYGYIFYSFTSEIGGFSPCLFKNVTGIACPSCGTTRALLMLFNGQFADSVAMNPLGLLAAIALIVVPVVLIIDIVSGKQRLLTTFQNFEKLVRMKPMTIVLVILIISNWVWNIHKNL